MIFIHQGEKAEKIRELWKQKAQKFLIVCHDQKSFGIFNETSREIEKENLIFLFDVSLKISM